MSGAIKPGDDARHITNAAEKIPTNQRRDRGASVAVSSTAVGGARAFRLAAVAVLDAVEHRRRRVAG